MASPEDETGDVFDVQRIRRLVELMREQDLSEIDLRDGSLRIKLRKGHDPIIATVAPSAGAASLPAAASKAAAPSAAEEPASEDHLALVTSPMVGTFFAAPSPEASPFIKVGDAVGKETTVCIIEAMKVFNEIPAEVSGRVVAVLVENGEPVEFGQPLFKVDTRQ